MIDIIQKIVVEQNRYECAYGKPANIIIVGYDDEIKIINLAIQYGVSAPTAEGYQLMGMTVTVSKSIQHGIAVTRMEQLT